MKTFLIISTGRTGTKALATYFSKVYPEVTAVHEPVFSRPLRIIANLYACGRVSPELTTRVFRWLRGPALKSVSTPIYIESSPYLRACMALLDDVYPDPAILHVTRHPADYVTSYINHGAFHGLKGLLGNATPYWFIKPEEFSPESGLRWRRMSEIERIAWRWTFLNRLIESRKEQFSGRYLRIGYEDIFDPDGPAIDRVADWMGLETGRGLAAATRQERVNISRSARAPRYGDWTDEMKSILIDYCGDLANAYGYELANPGA